MTDPAAPTPGGTTPPAPGQIPNPTPGQYPPPPQPGSVPPVAPGSEAPSPTLSSSPPPPAAGTVPPPPPGGVPPTAPPGSVPPPPYGAPPPAVPPKKSNALKIVLIVLGVIAALCIVCGVGGFFVLRNFLDKYGYNVGNCLDQMPVSEVRSDYYGAVVSCDSPEAEARIVAVHRVDDVEAALDESDTLCADAPGYVASVAIPTGSTGLLLCLAEP